jgi:hypothetical protein
LTILDAWLVAFGAVFEHLEGADDLPPGLTKLMNAVDRIFQGGELLRVHKEWLAQFLKSQIDGWGCSSLIGLSQVMRRIQPRNCVLAELLWNATSREAEHNDEWAFAEIITAAALHWTEQGQQMKAHGRARVLKTRDDWFGCHQRGEAYFRKGGAVPTEMPDWHPEAPQERAYFRKGGAVPTEMDDVISNLVMSAFTGALCLLDGAQDALGFLSRDGICAPSPARRSLLSIWVRRVTDFLGVTTKEPTTYLPNLIQANALRFPDAVATAMLFLADHDGTKDAVEVMQQFIFFVPISQSLALAWLYLKSKGCDVPPFPADELQFHPFIGETSARMAYANGFTVFLSTLTKRAKQIDKMGGMRVTGL